ncbi:hypothetical protein [Hyalangium gracile]|uniref:hypothetical protein n=1 Tax=Hyalangium gracile TaxID=394092 RepID=UPI001CCC1D81|nr:hypothetical protein [Hyalangium gracile]
MRALWGWLVCLILVACGETQRETVPPPTPPPELVEPTSPPPSSETDTPDAETSDSGSSETDTPEEGTPDSGLASWPPEGSVTCGSVLACRASLVVNGVCAQMEAPKGTSCSVSPTLPSGTCEFGGCILANPPRPNWTWSPDRNIWKVASRLSDSSLLLAAISSPYDPAPTLPDQAPTGEFISECRLTRFDPSRPDHETVLHTGGPCHPWVLHRRHAVGDFWSREQDKQMWALLDLEGGTPPRYFDLNALLQAQLAAENVTPATERPHWVQGAPGQLLLVWPLQGGKVWVGSLRLPELTFGWTHQVAGALRGSPIADELGRLYVEVEPGNVVSLSAEGAERWTQRGAGQPVAVFRDTLFLDDGTVLSTADGGRKYALPSSPASLLQNQVSVLLSESHAAVIAPCPTRPCSEVKLLRRATGELLAEAQVPYLHYRPSPEDVMGHLTSDGSVIVIQRVHYPALMTSPFDPVPAVRWSLLREGQPLQFQQELLLPEGENLESTLLHNGQWLAVERDSGRGIYHTPGADLIGVTTPGLRPPEHGWLAPRGNAAGGSAPE